MVEEEICEKCKGTGKILGRDGTIHICWDCLANGKFDQHGKDVRESGVKV